MKQLRFTVDLEDWYHGIPIPIESWAQREKRLHIGVEKLLSSLEVGEHKATFFVLGDAAKKHPGLIKNIDSAGHEIACHGQKHQLVYELSLEEFREDVKTSKNLLEDLTGKAVVGYRAPYFSITNKSLWAMEILRELGFNYDSSISPVKTWRYGIEGALPTPYFDKKTGILEIPVTTIQCFRKNFNFGGAYFRILPFSYFSNDLRTGSIEENAVFYIHPWEYDPKHPLARFKWKAMATHYWNLGCTHRRTQKLLSIAKSQTMLGLFQELSQTKDQIPIVDLSAKE